MNIQNLLITVHHFQRLAFVLTIMITLVSTPCLAFIAPQTDGGITPEEMEKAIGDDLKHPYLYFSSDELPELRKRVTSDPKSREIYAELMAEAKRLLYTPVEKNAPVPDKNPRFSGNWDYHYYIDRNRDRATLLAFLYQLTGEVKYAEKAFAFAELVCDVPNWEDRAHQFPIIYSRVMPYNVPDDQVVFNYDLYTGHTAHKMAVVYDWLYDWMNVRQRDRIRGALLEKAILRVRGNWDYQWWAWAYRCNWLTHCASGVGSAALALLTEDPQLIDVVAESYNRIWKTFDNIGEDGGWHEGVGYSSDNHHWAVLYGVPLKRMTDGQYSILKHPKIREHSVSFYLWTLLPPDQKVNFGDTGHGVVRKSAIFNALADEMQSPETAWYAKEVCADSQHSLWDIIFPATTVEPDLPAMKSRHFRSIDYVVMRSSFTDTETVTLVSKAGRHVDPHHGHLDCGDWGVHWRGESYIRGIGNIPYDEKCFDDERWTYPQAGSQGQNVIFVNGEQQIPGKWRGKPMDESIGGDVLEYRYGETLEYVLMDGTNAYPQQELKGWRRHLILDKPVVTVVLDEIECEKGALIESRIHPIGDIEVSDDNDFLLIKGESGMMALIAVADEPVKFVPGNHAYLPIQKKASLKKIPYVDTELTASRKKTKIVSIVLPVVDNEEAKAVSESVIRTIGKDGALTLSFSAKGQDHIYNFESTNEGLVLIAKKNSDEEIATLFEQGSSDWFEAGDADWGFLNGELIGTADSTGGFVMTKAVYNNFELTLDFKPDSTINSGIFIRCDSVNLSATDCYEINIWDLNPNQRYRTGAIVLRTEPQSYVETLNKWNSYKILVDNDHIQTWIDGVLMTDFHNKDLKEGHIGLQASGVGKIQFRNVSLREIVH